MPAPLLSGEAHADVHSIFYSRRLQSLIAPVYREIYESLTRPRWSREIPMG